MDKPFRDDADVLAEWLVAPNTGVARAGMVFGELGRMDGAALGGARGQRATGAGRVLVGAARGGRVVGEPPRTVRMRTMRRMIMMGEEKDK